MVGKQDTVFCKQDTARQGKATANIFSVKNQRRRKKKKIQKFDKMPRI